MHEHKNGTLKSGSTGKNQEPEAGNSNRTFEGASRREESPQKRKPTEPKESCDMQTAWRVIQVSLPSASSGSDQMLPDAK